MRTGCETSSRWLAGKMPVERRVLEDLSSVPAATVWLIFSASVFPQVMALHPLLRKWCSYLQSPARLLEIVSNTTTVVASFVLGLPFCSDVSTHLTYIISTSSCGLCLLSPAMPDLEYGGLNVCLRSCRVLPCLSFFRRCCFPLRFELVSEHDESFLMASAQSVHLVVDLLCCVKTDVVRKSAKLRVWRMSTTRWTLIRSKQRTVRFRMDLE